MYNNLHLREDQNYNVQWRHETMDMEKPVILSIRAVQRPVGGEDDVMELMTQGTLGAQEDGYTLRYEESELTGLEGTTTTFRVQKDKITLHREGTLNSEMVFQKGLRHISLYDTPYGGLTLQVQTLTAKAELDQSGGDLEIRYTLDVEDQRLGENFFQIHVSEPQTGGLGQQTTL